MRLSSWLRSAHPLFVPAGTKTARGSMRARRAWLRVEPLEERTVPSTFTVLNLADSGVGSLRQAVLDCNANPGADLIRFARSVRAGTITLSSGQLSITDALEIDGPGAGRLTVSGNDTSRVFQINSGVAVSIEGLTVSHGRAIGQGGGIFNAGTLALSHTVLSDNQAVGLAGASIVVDAFGGGIFNSGTLDVHSTSFVHNQAIGGDGTSDTTGSSALGGAIRSAGTASAPATVTVSDCMFLDNQARGGAAGAGASRAGVGGAIMNDAGTFTVSDSVFDDNQAVGGLDNGVPGGFGAGSGGAIANVARLGDAILSVSRCSMTNNRAIGGAAGAGSAAQAGRGGAVVNYIFGGLLPPVTITATASIDHSAMIGNQAIGGAGPIGGNGQGGGIANLSGGVVTVCYASIALNRAIGGAGGPGGIGGNGQGGGIFNAGLSPVGVPTLMLRSSLIALNRAEGGAAGQGGSTGTGQGGGLYLTAGGDSCTDLLMCILANDASSGNDDVFGTLGDC